MKSVVRKSIIRKSIVKIESKRILGKELLCIFFAVVFLLSAVSSYQAVKSYELWDANGLLVSGRENISYRKENAGFSEGWKMLNRDIGDFTPLVLLFISIIVTPLFADDAQTNMKELNRSAKNGKKQLDMARMITAFEIGSVLYFMAVICYFFVKMIPFGFSGGGEYIQSNADTFFSVFHITYMEQFLWNVIRGYVALLFVVSMTILISVIIERIMAAAAIICFYWVFLLIMEKMASFDVNHLFANFMPLRLVGGTDFYIWNEIYRFAGRAFDSAIWCPAVALFLSGVMTWIAAWRLHVLVCPPKTAVINHAAFHNEERLYLEIWKDGKDNKNIDNKNTDNKNNSEKS